MQKKYTAIRLLPVLLILLFSVLSLMLVLSGAGVYKNTVENTRYNNQVRATLSYVSNKGSVGRQQYNPHRAAEQHFGAAVHRINRRHCLRNHDLRL